MKKTFVSAVLAVMSLILLMSACGKVSAPVPVEGSGYPHTYPRR